MAYDPKRPISSAKSTVIEYLEQRMVWVKFLPDHPLGTLPKPLLQPHASFNAGQIITKPTATADYLGEVYEEATGKIVERRGKQAVISYPIDLWIGMSAKAGGPVERDNVAEALLHHLEIANHDLKALGIRVRRFSVGRSHTEAGEGGEQSEADSTLEILKTQCRLDVQVMVYTETEHDLMVGVDIQAIPKE